MKKDRRDFLKLARVAVTSVIGGGAVFYSLLTGGAVAAGPGRAGAAGGRSGIRLGMVIDIRKFIEHDGLAQRCIQACHSVHNVPDPGGPGDGVEWLRTDKFENVFAGDAHNLAETLRGMPVLTLCNHCDNPPCVRSCPTTALFRKSDGVVDIDYRHCIGCRFCMAACPYGALSFNWRDPRGTDAQGNPLIRDIDPGYPVRTQGVVEKCNFCAERLAVGKLPACVEEAAEFDAMLFGDLNDPDSRVSLVLRENFTIVRQPSLGTHPSVFYLI